MVTDLDFHISTALELSPFKLEELSDLVRDLYAYKNSNYRFWHQGSNRKLFSAQIPKLLFYGNRETEFLQYFTSEDELIHSHNVKRLFLGIGMTKYESTDWRFFIDRSKRGLKCVLLQNSKNQKYADAPIGYSTKLKEEYENVKAILRMLNSTNINGSYVSILKWSTFF